MHIFFFILLTLQRDIVYNQNKKYNEVIKLKNKLIRCLENKPENHILPFFWQHGDSDELIIKELHRIKESGVNALCVESRPHEGFVKDPWWEDMTLILEEATRLEMDVWVLDDKYFPTGFCNGVIPEKYPELGKRGLTERHVDVHGPVNDGAVILEGWAEEEDKLFAVIACRRGAKGEELTGECVDLTNHVNDGLVYVTLPDGIWRIFFIFERPVRDGRVDFTNPESVQLMIDEIYEPHFQKLGKYFGNTFKGFFSDEPFIMNHGELPVRGKTKSKGTYPWNAYIQESIISKYGTDWKLHLPSLWFTMNGISPKYRVDYMDTLTSLYKKHFCDFIGDWCRSHGVEYIGHVVEDYNQHSNTGSGGHFFRSLDGQSMAGIDVVLGQIVPGMTETANACLCWYDTADPDFFHYSLAKMGASHSHIQSSKGGRAMCEIFGAYGWAEGLKMMKWLADHMLVRGLNYFVPHAFSAQFPDEVPPQFSGGGHNPQFRYFRHLMEYMNRVSTILSDGRHHASAAILYHAEAEWSGGDYMYFYEPAKHLTNNNIDYDIISADYLMDAGVKDGKLVLCNEEYPCFIVPESEYLPERVISKLSEIARLGVKVIFINKITEKSCENPKMKADLKETDNILCLPLENLASWMRQNGYFDIKSSSDSIYMRFYHYSQNNTHVYMLTNEGIDETINAEISFSAFGGGDYAVYHPLENKAYSRESQTGNINISLEPYSSVMLFFVDIPQNLSKPDDFDIVSENVIEANFIFSVCSAEEYPVFHDKILLEKLKNVSSPDMLPKFGGFMKYECEFMLDKKENDKYVLDLGYVGESAELSLNSKDAGVRIAPPYTFDITDQIQSGKNKLSVTVANHLGYEQRDLCSKYLLMEPVGLLGPVKLKSYKKKSKA